MKNKVVVKGSKGPVLEAITWNATDLKDFPIQIEMKEKGKHGARCTSPRSASSNPTRKQFERRRPTYGLMK